MRPEPALGLGAKTERAASGLPWPFCPGLPPQALSWMCASLSVRVRHWLSTSRAFSGPSWLEQLPGHPRPPTGLLPHFPCTCLLAGATCSPPLPTDQTTGPPFHKSPPQQGKPCKPKGDLVCCVAPPFHSLPACPSCWAQRVDPQGHAKTWAQSPPGTDAQRPDILRGKRLTSGPSVPKPNASEALAALLLSQLPREDSLSFCHLRGRLTELQSPSPILPVVMEDEPAFSAIQIS